MATKRLRQDLPATVTTEVSEGRACGLDRRTQGFFGILDKPAQLGIFRYSSSMFIEYPLGFVILTYSDNQLDNCSMSELNGLWAM